jgi:hypothetical protein
LNLLCKEESAEKSLILPVCRKHERTAKYCSVSLTAVSKEASEGREKREMNEALCTHPQSRGLESLKD